MVTIWLMSTRRSTISSSKHNKYEPLGYIMRVGPPHKREEDVIVETQCDLPPTDTKVYSGELVQELRDMLQWYIDEDEVNEGQEGNEYWTEGKQKAIELLGRIE